MLLSLLGTIRRWLDFWLTPPRYSCAVCERRLHAFHPLPEYYHQQLRAAGWPHGVNRFETCNVGSYSCPNCGAADRDRLCALYLDQYFQELAGEQALAFVDFAPSPALSVRIRRLATARGVSYRTADLFMPGVDDQVDIMDLQPYADDSIDCCLCSHVLEHVSDDRRAMRELFRVLRTGGQCLVLVPIVLGIDTIDEDPTVTDPVERWHRFGQDDHVRLYSRAGLIERLCEARFAVRTFGLNHFGAELFASQGLAPHSQLYVAEKPALIG